MMTGVVDSYYQAVVQLALRGPSGQTLELDAIVDTGYNGFLTLPPGVIETLGLEYQSIKRAFMGDGRQVSFPVYAVTAIWDGDDVTGEADESNTVPLIGMQLLDGYRLCVDVHDGGRVTVEPRESSLQPV